MPKAGHVPIKIYVPEDLYARLDNASRRAFRSKTGTILWALESKLDADACATDPTDG